MSRELPASDIATTTDVPLLAGRYQLLDKLGEGGMGTVFRARDQTLNRFVAVKILPAGKLQDADAIARFRREALALAKLSHPHIIQAYDSGQDGDKHFLVMELVEGRSLAAELAEKGRLVPTRAADYARQAALALHHAHRLGLVHRDVKPSNLLRDAEGRVKLLDLGLTRFLQDQLGDTALTQEGSGMGTPDYCAPEQFRDAHKADARSDIYSLGCTLYHLIAGRPPFPGSSLSEKVKAHETQPPPPLEENCPEIPGGLALVVARMLAKRPADRFASMAEVAEALAPYVAAASPSFRDIRNTTTWSGSQLETMTAHPWRRARLPWLIAVGAALLALGAVGGLAYVLRHGEGMQVAQPTDDTNRDALETLPQPKDAKEGEPPSKTNKEPPADDPNVLTVSQDPKAGGRFRNLRAAVAAVDHPNMTIRVLDDAEYAEPILLRERTVQAGLTVEAPKRATLVQSNADSYALAILQVPRVTIRGFQVRVDKPFAGVGVTGHSPGVVLEDLHITSAASGSISGISVEALSLTPTDSPLVIQDCTISHCMTGIQVLGLNLQSKQAQPCQRLVLRRNHIANVTAGVWLAGQVSDTHLVANRISNCLQAGIRFSNLLDGSDSILVANNAIVNRRDCIQLQEPIEAARNIRIRNNLLLAEQAPDISFTGTDRRVLASWRVDHNGRPIFADVASGSSSPFPPTRDLTAKQFGSAVRPAPSGDWPRPAPDSPLAVEGAGKEDPSLPAYLGAVPPEGVEPWDWDRTWQMPKDAPLLTVSKKPAGGGKYRTINDALKDARPWATIRVLDAAEYNEHLSLKNKAKHEGIAIEAVKRATLVLAVEQSSAVEIRDVPDVRIAGFRFRDPEKLLRAGRSFVFANGDVAGVTLSNLDMKAKSGALGILLQQVRANRQPLTVEKCSIDMLNDGIAVVGNPNIGTCRGVRLSENRVRSSVTRGIFLSGALEDIQVTGNFAWGCGQAGLQIEDPAASLRRVLLANNTACDSLMGFRLVENNTPREHSAGQVELFNNLLFNCRSADASYLVLGPGLEGVGDGRELVKAWSFRGNARDLSGADVGKQLPLARTDRQLNESDLLSTDVKTPDRIRPASGSPLATFGSGSGPGLPAYVGALTPEGVEPWDWQRTWHTRTKRPEK